MSITTIIVDDEPLARKGLTVRLKIFDDVDVIAQCCNGREAIKAILIYEPDLMFLDIQMPGLSGFEVIQHIIEQGLKMPIIVFVTAFGQYAIKAFDVHAVDYLLKPTDDDRLTKTVIKIRKLLNSNKNNRHKVQLVRLLSDVTGNDYQQILTDLESDQALSLSNYSEVLAIKDGGELSLVPVNDILWIDAAGDYMCVHTLMIPSQNKTEVTTKLLVNEQQENIHILRKTMKELEACLDPRKFIRNHRSTIVNKNFIDKFCSQVNGEYFLVLKNGKQLKVSRSYKDKVKQAVIS